MSSPEIETISDYTPAERQAILLASLNAHNQVHSSKIIHLVEFSNLESFLEEHKADERCHFIVKFDEHYLALDLLQNSDSRSCLLLDAAGDFRSYQVMEKIQAQKIKTLVASGLSADERYAQKEPQKDSYNCSMFALDHAIQLALAENSLHTELAQVAEEDSFNWDQLPLNFLRNTQSVSFLEIYMSKKGISEQDQNSIRSKFETLDNGKPSINQSINQSIL